MSTSKQITVGWYYVMNEEASKIVTGLFEDGVQAGSIVTMKDEDFKKVQAGTIVLPLHMMPHNTQIIRPRLVQ